MSKPLPVTIDFETLGIESRPAYPPVPVGVAIKFPGRPAAYHAWGHSTGNNCCLSEAVSALQAVWQHPGGLLCHNSKFDLDVAEVHLGLKPPAWLVHDTLFLLFLDDPEQPDLRLKEASERLLQLPPAEQDAVADWLITNQPIPGIKISRSRSSDHYFGRYLAYAPGDLVGRYAKGDVDRTSKLFTTLLPRIKTRGMMAAYDRERRLMPVLLAMERHGLPVATRRLAQDAKRYMADAARLDAWVRRRLRIDDSWNLDSGPQLIEALIQAKLVDETQLLITETGAYQSNKAALQQVIKDKQLMVALAHRAQLKTCLHTFMLPWLAMAKRSGGLIYTTWHQTRGTGAHEAGVGTRTGRLSSTPNFQNIPTEFDQLFKSKAHPKLPAPPWPELMRLPLMRDYLIPFPGQTIINRDYSQQEPRILAHFDAGQLLQKYQVDPWIDFHDYAQQELRKAGLVYDRKPVKNTNLGLIYGMGVGKLAERNGMPVLEARALKKAIMALYPGLKEMYTDMRIRAKSHQPIHTWGGREYYCEPPKIINGRLREFDYKMVNKLIQGSAADCTKEALIRYHDAKHPTSRILLNVHDELAVSVERPRRDAEMEVLRLSMESIEFDVPMLTEGSVSSHSWHALKPYDKKGKRL